MHRFTHLLLFIGLTALQIHAQPIQRVEPPNWWAGMKLSEIQLLVYGDNISDLSPAITFPGIDLKETTRVENPNYLFLTLHIAPSVQTGIVPIKFYRGKDMVQSYNFEVKERALGSANRKGFNPSDVIYLITPDRFANGNPSNDSREELVEKANRNSKGGRHGGDLEGIANHLDYIEDMGFTAIWINPVLENNMPESSYHGYAITDFYNVDLRFGTNEQYKALCRSAREKDMKVIMDMVMNHCGSEHWFVKDPPMSDWLNYQTAHKITNHRRNTIQDIHASEYDKKLFSEGWFVPSMPDLNQNNPLLAQYLIQNTIWWIEYSGISGIRMDTYPYPDKYFMSHWCHAVMTEYPNFNIVGEEWTTNPAIVSYWQANKTNHDKYVSYLPSLMDFPIQSAFLNGLLHPEQDFGTGLVEVYETLALDFLYPDPYNLVIFPDNHDMDRFFTQIKGDFDLFKMGMVYYATMRGIPQFYYGTEILMNNDAAPNDHLTIRTDFPGGWKTDKVNAFTGKGLNQQQQEAQAFTRKLLNWRKTNEAIHRGRLVQFAPNNGVYVYFRTSPNKTVMVAFNKNSADMGLPLERFHEILKNYSVATDILNGEERQLSKSLDLKAKSAIILELK